MHSLNHKNRGMLQLAIVTAIALTSLLIGIVIYYNSLLWDLEAATCQTLNEVMLQEEQNFTSRLASERSSLEGFSAFVGHHDIDDEGLPLILNTVAITSDFDYVTYSDLEGVAVTNDGSLINISDRDYFVASKNGETAISEPISSKIRPGTKIIAISTPIIDNGKIEGVLVGTFKTDKLNELFLSSFGGYGYTYISASDGELISKTESEHILFEYGNILEAYKTATFFENDSYETMLLRLRSGEPGHSKYSFNGQHRMVHYSSLPMNGWNIFVIANPDGLKITANRMLQNAVLLTSALSLLFAMILIYSYLSQKRLTRELTNMAFVDDVTGHSSFGKFRIDAVDLINANSSLNYMLIKTDIEKFKMINEMYSMEIGNSILAAMAEALSHVLSNSTDAFARIHADEFVVLIGYKAEEELAEKKFAVDELFSQICAVWLDFKIITPQGFYKLAKGENDFDTIYEKANFAHRLAKKSDSKELEFDGSVKELAVREQELAARMELSLHAEEFKLYLQPKFRLCDETIVGAESLVRWIPEDGRIVYPGEFIPLFEQNNFVTKLDMYMFDKTCTVLRSWLDSGIEPITISVNFSRLHLLNQNFVSELAAIANRYDLPYSLLEIELTETTMYDNILVLDDVLHQIHDAGFTLSMDDFGTGYSSLSLLKDIPVDVIKIDKSFFDLSADSERAQIVIASVLDMAKKLKIHTVAEGVETIEHINLLKELGCEIVQGYYYAKPMPAEELDKRFREQNFENM